jgi:UDP:flavonoid glycosyltransferase YjiC (YdhE family)
VFDPTTFSGPLVAAKLGVPAVRHIWGMDFTYLSHEYEPDAIQPLADRLGVGRVDTLGAVTVDPCPPSLQVPNPVRRLVMRYAPYNGIAEVPDWLRHPPERPRICVTGSTVSGRFAGEQESLDARVVEALAGVDVEIVVVNPAEHSSLRRSAPANVRLVPQLAMHLLLPSCTLAIHAGGGGMVLTSIATGTPQLLVPSNPDHIFNARRLQELGAGWMLFSNHATNDMIRAYATDALDKEGLRVNTAKLRQEMAEQPSAAQVVASLAELAEAGHLSGARILAEACDVAA